MTNSEPLHSALTTSGTGTPTYDKQLPGVTRKTALRDVQNQKSSLISHHHENSLFLGARPARDPTRACGTKRLTPERPSSTNSNTSLSTNGTNEHILNVRRRFELEFGRGRIQNNIDKCSEGLHSAKHPPQKRQYQPMEGGNAHTVGFKVDDQQMTERFIRLQKFLKQCDESNQTDYIQMLLRLSPAELSRHAVDLEKRTIQLTIEEGKEMQRVRALNVLGK